MSLIGCCDDRALSGVLQAMVCKTLAMLNRLGLSLSGCSVILANTSFSQAVWDAYAAFLCRVVYSDGARRPKSCLPPELKPR